MYSYGVNHGREECSPVSAGEWVVDRPESHVTTTHSRAKDATSLRRLLNVRTCGVP